MNSDPKGAKVLLKTDKDYVEVGVTPLTLPDEYKNLNQYQFIVVKDGYQPQSIVMEKRMVSADADVFTKLEKFSPVEAQLSDPKVKSEVQKVSRTVASIQSDLIKRNYASAEGMAKELVGEYPYFAVGWNLLGNSYYLQNRQGEALSAYKKALQFEPDNLETKKLIETMEGIPPKGDR